MNCSFQQLAGIILLAVGIWMLADENSRHYFDIANNPDAQHAFRTSCIVILCLGILIALISFCGCCGAIRESNCLLMTVSLFDFQINRWFHIESFSFQYAVVLSLFLIIEITAGILAAVFKNDVSVRVRHIVEICSCLIFFYPRYHRKSPKRSNKRFRKTTASQTSTK